MLSRLSVSRSATLVSAAQAGASLFPGIVAVSILILTIVRALSGIDMTWDAISYHLPFVAIRGGFSVKGDYQILDERTYYFQGFPVVLDYIRAGLWWIVGKPSAINLLAVMSIVSVAAFARLMFGVAFSWCVIALYAIPAVQTSASSAYTDVPGNCFLLIVVLCVCELWVDRRKAVSASWWASLLVFAFLAANSKLQLSVLTGFALLFAIVPCSILFIRSKPRLTLIFGVSACVLIVAGLIEITLLRNLIQFGDPIYPFGIHLGPLGFNGPMTSNNSYFAPYFAYLPNPIRWLISIIEYRALELRPITYTPGMGNVPKSSAAARMGGFFGFLVVFTICFFVRIVCISKDRRSSIFLVTFIIMSCIIPFFPSSYRSRYYLVWMMFLVIGSLILVQSAAIDLAITFKTVIFSAFIFVTSVTGAVYFQPNAPLALALIEMAQRAVEKTARPDETLCANDWQQSAFLTAPLFHPDLAKRLRYKVRVGDCGELRNLPFAP